MRPLPALLFILLSCALLAPLRADPVLAVLGGEQLPYQEALAGLQEALGRPVRSVLLPAPLALGSSRVVVAFGTEAALLPYPGVQLVYAMVPDVDLRPQAGVGAAVRVEMLPDPQALAERLVQAHPGAHALALFDVRGGYQDYLAELAHHLGLHGVQCLLRRVDGPSDLPDALRALQGRVQGLWIPPSPLLLSPEAFNETRSYCASHALALFAPMGSLAKIGALAGIAPSFREIGRAAGMAVQQLLDGAAPPERVYPQRVQMVFSAGAAKRLGLALPKAEPVVAVVP